MSNQNKIQVSLGDTKELFSYMTQSLHFESNESEGEEKTNANMALLAIQKVLTEKSEGHAFDPETSPFNFNN